MTIPDLATLYPEQTEWKTCCEQLHQASSLCALVLSALALGLLFARLSLESELCHRGLVPTHWPDCPECKRPMRSKGFRPRQMETLIGQIHWKRRVGYCPNKSCKVSLSVPLDEALGIVPYQSSSEELKRLGCLMSIVMPMSYRVGCSINALACRQYSMELG